MSMPPFSEHQFNKVLKDTLVGGGSSTNLRTGESPKDGWMVSDYGSESQVQARNMSVNKIARHANKHATVLHGDPDAHLGTWRDAAYSDKGEMQPKPTDTVYLDVSRRHGNFLNAVSAGWRERQLAIYGPETGSTVKIGDPRETAAYHRTMKRLRPVAFHRG
jgi:hypothetical protein